MATFGKALTNIVKCDPDDGFVYPHKYYDFTHLFEEMKLKLFSRCLKISVREFMSDKECTDKKLIQLFLAHLDINHYRFVQKLNGIIKGKELFNFVFDCQY